MRGSSRAHLFGKYFAYLASHLALACGIAGAQGRNGQFSVLFVGQPAIFHADSGISFNIILEPGDAKFVSISIESTRSHTSFDVVSADNREIQTIVLQSAGWAIKSFALKGIGPYRLICDTDAGFVNTAATEFRAQLVAIPADHLLKRAYAESMFSSAEASRRSDRAADVHDAMRKYQEAAVAWKSIRDPTSEALALAGQAQAAAELSDYPRSINILDRALELSTDTVWLRAWLLNLKSQVFLGQWNSDAAQQNAQEALNLSKSLDDQWLISDALADLGESLYLVQDPSAESTIDDAMRAALQSDTEESEARALRCKAWLEEDIGHLALAISLMRRAQVSFQVAGNSRDALQASIDIATIEGMAGDHYGALMAHYRLFGLTRVSGDITNAGFLQSNIGEDYAELNRDIDAIPKFSQAFEIFARVHHLAGESITLGEKCVSELHLKRLDDALRDCQAAESIAEQLHAPKRLAIATWRLGTVQQERGQITEAIDDYSRAVDICEQVKDSRFESQALISWGDVLQSLHKIHDALPRYENALLLSTHAEDSTRLLESEFRVSRSYAQNGDWKAAKDKLEIALPQIDQVRRTVLDGDLQASYFAAVRKCYELYVYILMSQSERNSSYPAKALEVSELGRARTLLDVLASRSLGGLVRNRGDGSRDVVHSKLSVQKAYDRRLKLLLEGGHTRELRQNSDDLTQSIDALELAEDDSRATASVRQNVGVPLHASEITAGSIASGYSMLEFELGPERSYAWFIHDGTISTRVLPSRNEIASEVNQWRKLVTARSPRPNENPILRAQRVERADRDLQRVSAKLSCNLLDSLIDSNTKRLAVVADGALELLPFSALPRYGCQKKAGPPILSSIQVVMTPSLSVFLSGRQRRVEDGFSGDVALVADPVFDSQDSRVHLQGKSSHRLSTTV
jgi:tetratricopeptide (TPR) repeat protein